MEHYQVLMPWGSIIVWFKFFKRVVTHSPVQPTYFDVALCTKMQEKLQDSDDSTTSTWPWQHCMVHVKLHPPQQSHP